MDTTTFLILAVGVVVIALAIAIIPYITTLRRFAGYTELREHARAIQFFLHGETFRDMNDLVITGNTQGYRTTIRFSHAENTPAVQLRMDVPATFDLTVVPRDWPVTDSGQVIRLGNDPFENKWTFRSTMPTQSRIFLAGNTAMSQIRKLCCSSRTLLGVQPGRIELEELIVPEGSPSRHLIEHMESMAVIGKQLALMPGADQVKVERVSAPRPTSKVLMVVVGVIALITGISALANHQYTRRMAAATGAGGSPIGIPAEEALHIPRLQGWRLADRADFDPDLVAWLRHDNVNPTGRLEGDFSGAGIGTDHAYLLINAAGDRRLVVMLNGQAKYDELFPSVVLLAKVPKASIRDIKIDTGSPASGKTDGILLVRNKDDLHSGVVVSFNESSPVTAVPDNYKSTTLE